MKFRLFLLLLLTINSARTLGQEKNNIMPIIAYWGVPEYATNKEAFRTFSECGFTVSLYPYSSLENLTKACKVAEQYGIKVLGSCPEMKTSPTKAASILTKEQGFFGYIMQDEPSVPEIKKLEVIIKQLRRLLVI